jgi:hypothetical protein
MCIKLALRESILPHHTHTNRAVRPWCAPDIHNIYVCVCRGSGGGRWKWHKLQNAERAEPGDAAGEGAFSLSSAFIHSFMNNLRCQRTQGEALTTNQFVSLASLRYPSLSLRAHADTERMFSLLIKAPFRPHPLVAPKLWLLYARHHNYGPLRIWCNQTHTRYMLNNMTFRKLEC